MIVEWGLKVSGFDLVEKMSIGVCFLVELDYLINEFGDFVLFMFC